MRLLFVLLLLAFTTGLNASPVIFTVPDISVERGEVLQIPVKLAESGEFFGFQLAFTFDSTALSIENVTAGDATRTWGEVVYAVPESGRLSMSWFDAVSHQLDAAEALFYIAVKAHKNGRLRDWVSLQKMPLRPEIYDAGQKVLPIVLGFVSLSSTTGSGPEKAGFAVTNPQPNPTAAGSTMCWFLPAAGTVKFQLHDGSGKLIYEFEKQFPGGVSEFTLDNPIFPQAGAYIWSVWYGRERVSGTLVRL